MRPPSAVWIMAMITASAPVHSSLASDITELFESPRRSSAIQALSAEQIVRRAFENVFPSGFGMEIETTRVGTSREDESSEFRVYRRAIDGEMRILTESLAPPEIEGTRMLQMESSDGAERTFAYVRSVAREPFATTFRLADPFLCSWYDKTSSTEPAGAEPLQGAYRPPFQILSRRPDKVEGEPVQRILVRPLIDRGYDRLELAIAERDFAILEYLHFTTAQDAAPSLVARAVREDMVVLDGHVLPTRLRYEDRALAQVTVVSIRHSPIPPDAPDTLFDPRSFHRPRTAPLAPAGAQ